MSFRKVSATEKIYIETKSRYVATYEDFEAFARRLTFEAGVAKKASGKASSYARYLMRLIIFYEEFSSGKIDPIISFEAVKKLEKLSEHKHFKKYNADEGRFPSATLSCFRAYITAEFMEQEEYEDMRLNVNLRNNELASVGKESTVIYQTNTLVGGPELKLTKKPTILGTSYPRSIAESIEAKRRSAYTCEISHTHQTFKNAADHQNYIEAHHLIPMAAQDYFDYTIDFADNIVTLCPTCHRQIHYAVPEQKAELVEMLYKKRAENYLRYGIEIDFARLKNFYGVL